MKQVTIMFEIVELRFDYMLVYNRIIFIGYLR
jgi:hypothetical protein